MSTIKNCPAKYVKRSDVTSRTARVGVTNVERQTRQPRDFATAQIDRNFYVTFRPSQEVRKDK